MHDLKIEYHLYLISPISHVNDLKKYWNESVLVIDWYDMIYAHINISLTYDVLYLTQWNVVPTKITDYIARLTRE